MVASDAPAHNFFRRLLCPKTTVARTCFYPIHGAATSSPPCSTCPALLHVISLARLACFHTREWAATRPCRGPWSCPRKARSFRRHISAAYTTSTRGRRDGIRVLSNPFREGSLRRVGKKGPFVLVGEPIAAVNWCKGAAAQQRKLKNPQVSTPMEFLGGTPAHQHRIVRHVQHLPRIKVVQQPRQAPVGQHAGDRHAALNSATASNMATMFSGGTLAMMLWTC